MTTDEDLYGTARDYASSLVQLGTVGWANVEEHVLLGDLDNDGHTLIRVTLYAGRTQGTPAVAGVADGHEILCHAADGVFRIPPKGARAYVIIPAGMEGLTGAGVIVATVNPGLELKRNPVDGDTVLSAPGGGEAQVLVKKDGSVTIHTTDTNTPEGNSIFFRISPAGLEFRSPYGKVILDHTGFHAVPVGGARLDLGRISIPGLPGAIADSFDSYATIKAAMVKVAGGTVYLGQGTTYQPVVSTLPLVATNFLPAGIAIPAFGPQPNLVGAAGVWAAL